MGGRDAGKGVESRIDRGDEGIVMVEIAGFAGAEIAVAIVIGDGRGPALGVDPVDQLCAFLGREEVAANEEGQILARHALHAGVSGDPGGIGVEPGGCG